MRRDSGEALNLVPGDGEVGSMLVDDPQVAGVAFTGSTEVGRGINRALSAKRGPIVPLIAETGGINAMIADATALPEQVTDDVIASAFRSAGQRCSASRLLFLQEEVAERMLDMIIGAAQASSRLGDPATGDRCRTGDRRGSEEQARSLGLTMMQERGALRFRWDANKTLPNSGTYVPPRSSSSQTRASSRKNISARC